MKLFIFGAGASVASQGNLHENSEVKAPLANDLFHQRYFKYADEVGLPSRELYTYSLQIGSGSVEEWLTNRWQKIDTHKTSVAKQAERKIFGQITLYLWRMLQKVSGTYNANNNYRIFLRDLFDKDIEFGIIDFNYDTLLDRAVMCSSSK